MVTRRQTDRVFREMFPEHVRHRKAKQQEWFQSLNEIERMEFIFRFQGEVLKKYGDFPRPISPARRFPHSECEVISLPARKRRELIQAMLADCRDDE